MVLREGEWDEPTNCAQRKREMILVPWEGKDHDFPPQVGSRGKVDKVLLTFNPSRWNRLHTRQAKDAA